MSNRTKKKIVVLVVLMAIVILSTVTAASATFDEARSRTVRLQIGETVTLSCPTSRIVSGTPYTVWRHGKLELRQPFTCQWGLD